MIFKNPKSLDLIVQIKLTMGEGGEKIKAKHNPKIQKKLQSNQNLRIINILAVLR